MKWTPKILYRRLLKLYGPQGWWPVRCEISGAGYHPEIFQVPSSSHGRYEVCLGAVLTQNTSWVQVDKVLNVLQRETGFDPERLLNVPENLLQEWIRPAGYFRQKSRYLCQISLWFEDIERQQIEPGRSELLKVQGVGPETADSILLYAFHQPTFVIDAYTRRILEHLGVAQPKASYESLRAWFMLSLPQDVVLFQEYHALLVAHAKAYYQKGSPKPDPLKGA